MKAVVMGVAALLSLVPQFSQSAIATLNQVRVTKTLIADDGRWGECMAEFNRSLASVGLDCPGNWVSFSCSGDFTTKDNANRMFESARMAQALGFRAYVVVNDQLKHNGYCYANRIDLFE